MLLFFILIQYKNNQIIEIMAQCHAPASYIKESKNGEIDLYGIKFTRGERKIYE